MRPTTDKPFTGFSWILSSETSRCVLNGITNRITIIMMHNNNVSILWEKFRYSFAMRGPLLRNKTSPPANFPLCFHFITHDRIFIIYYLVVNGSHSVIIPLITIQIQSSIWFIFLSIIAKSMHSLLLLNFRIGNYYAQRKFAQFGVYFYIWNKSLGTKTMHIAQPG